jgi:hypothetical protein
LLIEGRHLETLIRRAGEALAGLFDIVDACSRMTPKRALARVFDEMRAISPAAPLRKSPGYITYKCIEPLSKLSYESASSFDEELFEIVRTKQSGPDPAGGAAPAQEASSV